MKRCKKCNIEKEQRFFSKKLKGFQEKCKMCCSIENKEYRESVKRNPRKFLNSLHNNMSKRFKNDIPKDLFIDFYLINPLFIKLHKEYVDSGCEKLNAPSIDRIDDYKHYTWANTRMVTFYENVVNAGENRAKGINNKVNKSVLRIGKKDVKKKYSSIALAAKDNNIDPSNISRCLKGETKTSAGFKWEYYG